MGAWRSEGVNVHRMKTPKELVNQEVRTAAREYQVETNEPCRKPRVDGKTSVSSPSQVQIPTAFCTKSQMGGGRGGGSNLKFHEHCRLPTGQYEEGRQVFVAKKEEPDRTSSKLPPLEASTIHYHLLSV